MSDKERKAARVKIEELVKTLPEAQERAIGSYLDTLEYEPPTPLQTVMKIGYVKKLILHLDKDPSGGTSYSELPERQNYLKVTIGSDEDDRLHPPMDFVLLRNIQSTTSVNYYSPLDLKVPYAVDWCSVSMAIISTLRDALIHNKKVRVVGICYRYHFSAMDALNPFGDLYNELHTVEIMQ